MVFSDAEKQKRYRDKLHWKRKFADEVDLILHACELVPDFCQDPDWCAAVLKRILEVRKEFLT